jgi:hypothetical protein
MIAVDPASSTFSVAHTESNSLFGSQTHVVTGHFACAGGQLQPVFNGGPANPNPACYNPATGCPPNPDGTPSPNGFCGADHHPCFVVNDQWGSQIAFLRNGGTPETVVTWYDTRGDQYNNHSAVWAMYSTNLGATWSNPFQVSSGTWDETQSWWWDYQALAPSSTNFLAAWGGDAHLGTGLDGIWSAIIQ